MQNDNMLVMKLPYTDITESCEFTEAVGAELAKLILSDESIPCFVAMYGDLGVGKTAFVRGLCSVICPNSTVKSPTFALVNEYRSSNNIRGIKNVCHFDMYRVSDEDDLYSIGFYDYLKNENLCIAEWSELISYALPERYVRVMITKSDVECEYQRNIVIDIVEHK